ncbi:MAG: DASS family sodium-coupled anion symporter, partial [Halieaceae bacterium]|nr:DASS family sodium-coupled anion symporter [Halieaceae bacterium]
VLYPIVDALATDSGSAVEEGSRRKLGAYLMMCSMSGLTISSAMWLTAMAANPVGVAMAAEYGVELSYASWVLAASLPCLMAFIALPRVLYTVFPPEQTDTPDAPRWARDELNHMGPLLVREKIMAGTFIGMVGLWIASAPLGLDKAAIAFLGIAVLMLSGIFTPKDIYREGRALETLIWFAILFAMSSNLNNLGFMSWVGGFISVWVEDLSWPWVYTLLIVAYVGIHYFFVSQTAQMLALFSVFLSVAMNAGVPGELMALMLLFATNFNAVIAPQGSSCNVIYVGSGYIESGEVYRYGGIVTLVNLLIFLIPGTLWILLVI